MEEFFEKDITLLGMTLRRASEIYIFIKKLCRRKRPIRSQKIVLRTNKTRTKVTISATLAASPKFKKSLSNCIKLCSVEK